MALVQRPSPVGKKVSLFVTCIVDMVYPQTGMSVVDILEHLGIHGQPGFNAGYRKEAREVARQFLRAFKDAEVIVTPSGSCAAMVRHEYPTLFEDDPLYKLAAERAASITWEFTEFLVDGLGITDLHLRFPEPRTFTFHDACHGLRMLGLGKAGRTLLEKAENATVIELRDAETCCGFGGLFSVKMPDVSGAMLHKKMTCIRESTADVVVTGDAGCLTHINGGLSRQQDERRIQHIADVLASALQEKSLSAEDAPKLRDVPVPSRNGFDPKG
jgi:L-lactate dehydrogenase complex protein LldE